MEQKNQDSSKEQKESTRCEKHGCELEVVVFTEFFKRSFCPECAKEEEAEELKKKEIENERIRKANIIRGIPKLFHHSSVKNIDEYPKIKEWLKSDIPFLFIHGDCGCGKTYLSCAIKKRFNELGYTCSLFFSSDLFLRIRKSFSNESETEEMIISECSPNNSKGNFAIFDDIGLNKASEYTIETWYNIINRRYMNCSKTMFTSNLTLDEISAKMSDRISSRLASGVVHKMSGTDKRLDDHKIRNLCEVF